MDKIYIVYDYIFERQVFVETSEEAYELCKKILFEDLNLLDSEAECCLLELIDSYERDSESFGVDTILIAYAVERYNAKNFS